MANEKEVVMTQAQLTAIVIKFGRSPGFTWEEMKEHYLKHHPEVIIKG